MKLVINPALHDQVRMDISGSRTVKADLFMKVMSKLWVLPCLWPPRVFTMLVDFDESDFTILLKGNEGGILYTEKMQLSKLTDLDGAKFVEEHMRALAVAHASSYGLHETAKAIRERRDDELDTLACDEFTDVKGSAAGSEAKVFTEVLLALLDGGEDEEKS